jgi:hypothetical protein
MALQAATSIKMQVPAFNPTTAGGNIIVDQFPDVVKTSQRLLETKHSMEHHPLTKGHPYLPNFVVWTMKSSRWQRWIQEAREKWHHPPFFQPLVPSVPHCEEGRWRSFGEFHCLDQVMVPDSDPSSYISISHPG